MLNWTGYKGELMGRIGELAKLSPDTVRGYQALSAAGAKAGQLDVKTRELISIAVAVALRCDGCISVHVDAALKNSATEPEIAEALGVSIAMNAGAALVYSARTLDAVQAHRASCTLPGDTARRRRLQGPPRKWRGGPTRWGEAAVDRHEIHSFE